MLFEVMSLAGDDESDSIITGIIRRHGRHCRRFKGRPRDFLKVVTPKTGDGVNQFSSMVRVSPPTLLRTLRQRAALIPGGRSASVASNSLTVCDVELFFSVLHHGHRNAIRHIDAFRLQRVGRVSDQLCRRAGSV